MNEAVQFRGCKAVPVVRSRIDCSAAIQHIVERDETTGTEKREALFVISRIACFISVDKSEIEAAVFARGKETGERLFGGSNAEIDFARHSGFRPVTPRD